MYGARPASVFLVFGGAKPGRDEDFERYYLVEHGPDSIEAGAFSSLHRYWAAGPYAAPHLAVWEAGFATLEEGRAALVPLSQRLRAAGRISDAQETLRSALHLRAAEQARTGGPGPGMPHGPDGAVRTLTLVEGVHRPPAGAGAAYPYGAVVMYESPDPPEVAARRWAGVGAEGIATYGTYTSIFDDPGSWLGDQRGPEQPWVSHWRPAGSLPERG